jgi:hypothetical protein
MPDTELQLGEPAPATGRYEELNVFGMLTGTIVDMRLQVLDPFGHATRFRGIQMPSYVPVTCLGATSPLHWRPCPMIRPPSHPR